MALQRTIEPTVDPISLEEAKLHLHVTHSDEDSLIAIYIRAARDWVEGPSGFLGRALVTQTWRLSLDSFPTAEIKIPLPPLQSVVGVFYDDPNGVEQTISPDDYYVDNQSEPGWVLPVVSWPTPLAAINSVRIDYVAGYAATADSPPSLTGKIPFNIKAAMLLIIGHLHENRAQNIVGLPVDELPMGVDYLLRQYKIHLSMQ
jgi:uncharacterized phiE125 gp8 family phage protein